MPELDGMADDRAVEYWRAVLRRALSDNSTVDWYDISDAGVDNLALIAAKAVIAELRQDQRDQPRRVTLPPPPSLRETP